MALLRGKPDDRIGIYRSVGVFLPNVGCFFADTGWLFSGDDWNFRCRGLF